jgi:hypothetical protein
VDFVVLDMVGDPGMPLKSIKGGEDDPLNTPLEEEEEKGDSTF